MSVRAPFPLFAPQQLSFAQTDQQFSEDKWVGGRTGAGGDTECSGGTVCWGRQEEEDLRDGKKKNLVVLHSGILSFAVF